MSQSSATVNPDRLTRVAALAAELGAADTGREAEELGERLAAGRLFVTCLGQFKRGKSTLINALLGGAILPAGIAPVTSVVTIVRHGAETRAVVRYVGGRSDTVDVSALSSYISDAQNPDNQKQVAVVEVFVPSEILLTGLCLVDTPGLGSVSVAGSEITRRFIPRVDAALVILGVDPPITEDEIALVGDVAAETQTLIFVLNKADKSRHEDVLEARAYTERVLSDRLKTPVKVLAVSAVEALELHHETRQWSLLESALRDLASGGESAAVHWREQRVVARLLQQLRRDAIDQRQMLLEPLAGAEARVQALEAWLADADTAIRELSHRLAAQEDALTPVLAAMKDTFLREAVPRALDTLQQRASVWPVDRHLHDAAMSAAHDIAEKSVHQWLNEIEPAAAQRYSEVTMRFAGLANELLRRLAEAEPALADLPPLQPDLTFRMDRRFYFTGLPRLTGGSLASRLILIGRGRRQHFVLRRASGYLHRLLEVNASRVYEDLRQRVFESRRLLESELRLRIRHLVASARRAAARAAETRQRGEEAVRAEDVHLRSLLQTIDSELELLSLTASGAGSTATKGAHAK